MKPPKRRLVRAVNRLIVAHIDVSWKGSYALEDREGIDKRLKQAIAEYHRILEDLYPVTEQEN